MGQDDDVKAIRDLAGLGTPMALRVAVTLGLPDRLLGDGSTTDELAVGLELLLSGRLVPLPLMPDWAEDVANVLPFKYSFYFPIETLVGDMSNRELLEGLGQASLRTGPPHPPMNRSCCTARHDQSTLPVFRSIATIASVSGDSGGVTASPVPT